MNPVIEKRLFSHVDVEVYDKDGFIDYRNIKEVLEMKVKNIASAVRVTRRSLEKNPKSEKIQSTLRKIAYVHRTLEEMTGSKKEALVWLRAPNPEYNGLAPIEIISQGKVDSIIDYLDDVRKGALT